MTPQQQYIAEWHDNFVRHINGLLDYMETLIILPHATDEDKRVLNQIKMMLCGKDAKDIEQDFSAGVIKQETIDKIEKLDKDLTDMAVEHLTAAPLVKEFLRRLTHCQIEKNKQDTLIRLQILRIPIH